MDTVERKSAYKALRTIIDIDFVTWMEFYGKDYTLNDCTKEMEENLYILKKLAAMHRCDMTEDDLKELAARNIYMELLSHTSNLRIKEAGVKFIKLKETED